MAQVSIRIHHNQLTAIEAQEIQLIRRHKLLGALIKIACHKRALWPVVSALPAAPKDPEFGWTCTPIMQFTANIPEDMRGMTQKEKVAMLKWIVENYAGELF